MANNAMDVMASLTLIMNEETERLGMRERGRDLAELAAAKVRLVGVLETELARLERERPDWAKAMDEEGREQLTATLLALGDASAANAAILERQIDLSIEMMGAVASEARRLANRRAATYSAAGGLTNADLAAPISVNSEY
ncbi:hypothetical protein ACFB49_45720 [Sphingomonas sp. DBB INV C78]|uniref:flagellar biosynthesis protein FlgN n=1 Tax=Sphingomonas sp. DBB INV C78 TaxID=3349434 RepID=UPI0036D35C9C